LFPVIWSARADLWLFFPVGDFADDGQSAAKSLAPQL